MHAGATDVTVFCEIADGYQNSRGISSDALVVFCERETQRCFTGHDRCPRFRHGRGRDLGLEVLSKLQAGKPCRQAPTRRSRSECVCTLAFFQLWFAAGFEN